MDYGCVLVTYFFLNKVLFKCKICPSVPDCLCCFGSVGAEWGSWGRLCGPQSASYFTADSLWKSQPPG